MAKRTRGSARPGQLAPAKRASAHRSTPRAAATPQAPPARPAGSLTDAEEARAAQLEAQILAEEREAEAARRRVRTRNRGGGELAAAGIGVRGESLMSARTTQEYAYVQKDLRRIATVSGGLLALLLVLWVLIEVVGIRL